MQFSIILFLLANLFFLSACGSGSDFDPENEMQEGEERESPNLFNPNLVNLNIPIDQVSIDPLQLEGLKINEEIYTDFDNHINARQILNPKVSKALQRRVPLMLLTYHYKDREVTAGAIKHFLFSNTGQMYQWTEYIAYGDRLADEIRLGAVSLAPDGSRYSVCYWHRKRINLPNNRYTSERNYMCNIHMISFENGDNGDEIEFITNSSRSVPVRGDIFKSTSYLSNTGVLTLATPVSVNAYDEGIYIELMQVPYGIEHPDADPVPEVSVRNIFPLHAFDYVREYEDILNIKLKQYSDESYYFAFSSPTRRESFQMEYVNLCKASLLGEFRCQEIIARSHLLGTDPIEGMLSHSGHFKFNGNTFEIAQSFYLRDEGVKLRLHRYDLSRNGERFFDKLIDIDFSDTRYASMDFVMIPGDAQKYWFCGTRLERQGGTWADLDCFKILLNRLDSPVEDLNLALLNGWVTDLGLLSKHAGDPGFYLVNQYREGDNRDLIKFNLIEP